MSATTLAHAIASFIGAIEKADISSILAAFSTQASVSDRGRSYGQDTIRDWAEDLPGRHPTAVRLVDMAVESDAAVVTLLIGQESGDAGALPATEWTVEFAHDRIASVNVHAEFGSELPAPVAAFASAMNDHNLDRLLDAMADDAIVNDQFHEYRGMRAIKSWAARDVIDVRMTMQVTKATRHYHHTIVTARVDGAYDKRGLPDPLLLSFYFSTRRGRIVQLIMLRNETAF